MTLSYTVPCSACRTYLRSADFVLFYIDFVHSVLTLSYSVLCRSLISSRIRTSRSHESLLSNPSAMQAVDVTGRDTEVKPVHHSVLSQDHCFHVATSHGSKYISCRTAEERDKWLSR